MDTLLAFSDGNPLNFSFGFKLLLSVLLHTIYLNLYDLVIGKIFHGGYWLLYSSKFYSSIPIVYIVAVLTRAVYPIKCEWQEYSFIQCLRISYFVVFPLMIGMVV